MKPYRITITTPKGRTEMTGLFSCAIDAILAGLDQLTDPHGRVEVKPA